MKSFLIVIFLLLTMYGCDLYRYSVTHVYNEFSSGEYRFSFNEYTSLGSRYNEYRLERKNAFGDYKDIKFDSYRWDPELFDKWGNRIDSVGCFIYYYRGKKSKDFKPEYSIDTCNDTIVKL